MKSTETWVLIAIEDGTREEDRMRGGGDGTKARWGYCCSEGSGEHCCFPEEGQLQVTGEGQPARRLEENTDGVESVWTLRQPGRSSHEAAAAHRRCSGRGIQGNCTEQEHRLARPSAALHLLSRPPAQAAHRLQW